MRYKKSSRTKDYLTSFIILFITSVISSLGGLSFQSIEVLIAKVLPILVIFPSLNDLMGNFAIIFSSKFTTWLYEGSIKEAYAFDNNKMKKLLKEISFAGFQFSILIAVFGILIAFINEGNLNPLSSIKVILISIIVVQVMIIFLFLLITIIGIILFKKNKNPDDVLIPISTAIADFLTMIYLATFVLLLFR